VPSNAKVATTTSKQQKIKTKKHKITKATDTQNKEPKMSGARTEQSEPQKNLKKRHKERH